MHKVNMNPVIPWSYSVLSIACCWSLTNCYLFNSVVHTSWIWFIFNCFNVNKIMYTVHDATATDNNGIEKYMNISSWSCLHTELRHYIPSFGYSSFFWLRGSSYFQTKPSHWFGFDASSWNFVLQMLCGLAQKHKLIASGWWIIGLPERRAT